MPPFGHFDEHPIAIGRTVPHFAVDQYLRISRLDAQSLECAVEVVDDAGVVAVDKHLRFLRLDLEADGGAGIAVIAIRRIRGVWIRPPLIRRAPPRIVVPERIVEAATHDDDARWRDDANAATALRLGWHGPAAHDQYRHSTCKEDAFVCRHGSLVDEGRHWHQ